MSCVLEFQKASVGYSRNPLLKGVNLQLQSGQRGVITGPNGCGKSTLLKSILDPHLQISGRIELKIPRQKLAWLSQWPRLDWGVHCSVSEFLLSSWQVSQSLWSSFDSKQASRITSLMEKFDFVSKKDHAVADLSGGELQRLMLCRALVVGAELLLMDEPFSALDIKSKPRFIEILNEKRSETAQLLVLHDRRDIEKIKPDWLFEVGSDVAHSH